MANEFKVKKGLVVDGTGTVLDIQGTQGQLFSVTDSLTGDLFTVSDISGVPILNVNSSGLVTIDGNVNLPDNNKILLGTGNDLEIYHTGSHSFIQDVGTGMLAIDTNGTDVRITKTDSEFMAKFVTDAEVQLYYNGSKKFETTSAGATVTGTLTASADIVAYSDERLKTNIKTLDGSKVYEMRGVSFTKEDKQGSGVIAQELEKIAPELVSNDNEYKAVAYGNITGYLIEAIKEQQKQIDELKKLIKDGNNL